jgi:hypothetical protein
VPRGCGDHGGICAGLVVPLLEASLNDLDGLAARVSPRMSGQRRPGLERSHPHTAPGQRQCGLARARAHLQNAVAWLQARNRDQSVEQLPLIGRPGLLVQVGSTVECRR